MKLCHLWRPCITATTVGKAFSLRPTSYSMHGHLTCLPGSMSVMSVAGSSLPLRASAFTASFICGTVALTIKQLLVQKSTRSSTENDDHIIAHSALGTFCTWHH
ncbi:hypothetical protein V5799_020460 [Amblyomma americanum]|uniref:Uncharacterized protein n=1 Tax=Amblyomma americanum TaxID=6943 RepID=A0AAQ4EUA0_AMBAM